MKQAVKNTADREQVNAAALNEKVTQERDLNDLRIIMNTKEGRRFMWRLLSEARIFTTRYSENSLRMAYLEGNANFGLMLMADIDAACPEQFDTMRREQREDTNND